MTLSFAFKNGSSVSATVVFGGPNTTPLEISNFIKDVKEFINTAYSKNFSRYPAQFLTRFVAFWGHENIEISSKKDPNAFLFDISDNKIATFLYCGEKDLNYRRRRIIVSGVDSKYVQGLDVDDGGHVKKFLRSRILADTLFSS